MKIFASIPDTINTPELRLDFTETSHYEFVQQLQELANFESGELSTVDGIRVDFADGFGLARASNTTPTLIMRFEADNQPALERIQNQFREQMLAVDSRLELPF